MDGGEDASCSEMIQLWNVSNAHGRSPGRAGLEICVDSLAADSDEPHEISVNAEMRTKRADFSEMSTTIERLQIN